MFGEVVIKVGLIIDFDGDNDDDVGEDDVHLKE